MVKKISVNVLVPSLGIENNLLIPCQMNVGEAISLIADLFKQEYVGVQQSRLRELRLLQLSTGKILDGSASFEQLGIIQGENLALL